MITRNIPYHAIVEAVRELAIRAAYELPDDVKLALQDAAAKESNPRARQILDQLIENYQIAEKDRIPLCQDTGLAIVFVELGNQIAVTPPHDRTDATLITAINEGITQGYQDGFLRKSVVAEPLNHRKNTTTNTPAVIHLSLVSGDRIHITLIATCWVFVKIGNVVLSPTLARTKRSTLSNDFSFVSIPVEISFQLL